MKTTNLTNDLESCLRAFPGFSATTSEQTAWHDRCAQVLGCCPGAVTCGRDPITAYLDWTNNYLTVGKFAEDYGIDIDTAYELIEEGRQLHSPEFTVVAVSANTNSFGLRQCILLSGTGEGWKVCRTSQFCPKEGDVVKGRDFSTQGFELVEKLPNLEPDKAKKILKTLTKH